MDMPMKFTMVVSGTGDTQQEKAGFYSGAGHQSACEWGGVDQMQPYSAVSTVKLIDLANSQADKIFSATSANYAATVKPLLINYNGAELALVESYPNAGLSRDPARRRKPQRKGVDRHRVCGGQCRLGPHLSYDRRRVQRRGRQ